jgi:hypothetical protein
LGLILWKIIGWLSTKIVISPILLLWLIEFLLYWLGLAWHGRIPSSLCRILSRKCQKYLRRVLKHTCPWLPRPPRCNIVNSLWCFTVYLIYLFYPDNEGQSFIACFSAQIWQIWILFSGHWFFRCFLW